jgi:hypothetical protein
MRSWFLILLKETNGRQKLSCGVLCINSVLNGMTVNLYVFLLKVKGITGSNK